jgi:hypothetical protein
MSTAILPVELARWDALTLPHRGQAPAPPPMAMALPIFADERPLRGAAGLCDWRLTGRLSRLIKRGRFSGALGETLLVPPAGGRLPFSRLLLYGLGPSAGFDDATFKRAAAELRRVMHRAGLSSYAVQLPGRSSERVAARRALELWHEAARADKLEAQVTLIELPGAQKELADLLRR